MHITFSKEDMKQIIKAYMESRGMETVSAEFDKYGRGVFTFKWMQSPNINLPAYAIPSVVQEDYNPEKVDANDKNLFNKVDKELFNKANKNNDVFLDNTFVNDLVIVGAKYDNIKDLGKIDLDVWDVDEYGYLSKKKKSKKSVKTDVKKNQTLDLDLQ